MTGGAGRAGAAAGGESACSDVSAGAGGRQSVRSGIGGGADHLPWLQPLWLGSLQIQHTWAKVQLDRQGLSWFQFQQMGFPSSFFKCAPAGKFGLDFSFLPPPLDFNLERDPHHRDPRLAPPFAQRAPRPHSHPQPNVTFDITSSSSACRW